jgi:hypothetical protein
MDDKSRNDKDEHVVGFHGGVLQLHQPPAYWGGQREGRRPHAPKVTGSDAPFAVRKDGTPVYKKVAYTRSKRQD